jgi:hypothetical protein
MEDLGRVRVAWVCVALGLEIQVQVPCPHRAVEECQHAVLPVVAELRWITARICLLVNLVDLADRPVAVDLVVIAADRLEVDLEVIAADRLEVDLVVIAAGRLEVDPVDLEALAVIAAARADSVDHPAAIRLVMVGHLLTRRLVVPIPVLAAALADLCLQSKDVLEVQA